MRIQPRCPSCCLRGLFINFLLSVTLCSLLLPSTFFTSWWPLSFICFPLLFLFVFQKAKFSSKGDCFNPASLNGIFLFFMVDYFVFQFIIHQGLCPKMVDVPLKTNINITKPTMLLKQSFVLGRIAMLIPWLL